MSPWAWYPCTALPCWIIFTAVFFPPPAELTVHIRRKTAHDYTIKSETDVLRSELEEALDMNAVLKDALLTVYHAYLSSADGGSCRPAPG